MSIRKWRTKLLRQLDKTKRDAAIKLFSDVIQASPVANPDLWKTPYKPKGVIGGRFRANWICSLNSPDESTKNSIDNPVPAMKSVMTGSTRNTTDFLQNNLPYAQRLEEGWSTQAPDGIVKAQANPARWKRIVNIASK